MSAQVESAVSTTENTDRARSSFLRSLSVFSVFSVVNSPLPTPGARP